MLVLSLFPGVGLLDRAFEDEGFCVVRGPDLLWGGDIRRFSVPVGRFDGIIGGPPCQFASQMRHINGGTRAINQIPEFERVVAEAQPDWFLMENVPEAPLPSVAGYRVAEQLVRDHWCGGETMRLRRFSFGSYGDRRFRVETLALHRPDPEPAALASGGNDPTKSPAERRADRRRKGGHGLSHMGFKTSAVFRDHCRLQGLPPDFDLPGFTVEAKIRAVGNGVPYAMGRAVARAVRAAIQRLAADGRQICRGRE